VRGREPRRRGGGPPLARWCRRSRSPAAGRSRATRRRLAARARGEFRGVVRRRPRRSRRRGRRLGPAGGRARESGGPARAARPFRGRGCGASKTLLKRGGLGRSGQRACRRGRRAPVCAPRLSCRERGLGGRAGLAAGVLPDAADGHSRSPHPGRRVFQSPNPRGPCSSPAVDDLAEHRSPSSGRGAAQQRRSAGLPTDWWSTEFRSGVRR
jgi:hypothetical protein